MFQKKSSTFVYVFFEPIFLVEKKFKFILYLEIFKVNYVLIFKLLFSTKNVDKLFSTLFFLTLLFSMF